MQMIAGDGRECGGFFRILHEPPPGGKPGPLNFFRMWIRENFIGPGRIWQTVPCFSSVFAFLFLFAKIKTGKNTRCREAAPSWRIGLRRLCLEIAVSKVQPYAWRDSVHPMPVAFRPIRDFLFLRTDAVALLAAGNRNFRGAVDLGSACLGEGVEKGFDGPGRLGVDDTAAVVDAAWNVHAVVIGRAGSWRGVPPGDVFGLEFGAIRFLRCRRGRRRSHGRLWRHVLC